MPFRMFRRLIIQIQTKACLKTKYLLSAMYYELILSEKHTINIPFVFAFIHGCILVENAFNNESKRYRRKQQCKICCYILLHYRFASKWFKEIESDDLVLVRQYRPAFFYKPFRVYMSIDWTPERRVKVILDTYRFVTKYSKLYQAMMVPYFEIARFRLNDSKEGIILLGYDYRYRKEGEFVLSFECEHFEGIVASVAFSFEEISGSQWICRIGCVQGHKKNTEYIVKRTQKLLYGLRPKSLVVFALQRFISQFQFVALYGAGDEIQAYRQKHAIHIQKYHRIHFDYNAFWTELNGEPECNGWYRLPMTPEYRNLSDIKTSKRAQYRHRYQMMDGLSEKISQTASCLKND